MRMGIALALSGCATDKLTLPTIAFARQPWQANGFAGVEVRSPHYRVLTTVRDPAVTDRFVRVLEAAHAEYAALLPARDAGGPLLDVYLFARPEEWETFTRRLTGPAAGVYLSVGPGGFAYGDTFVCWLFNEPDLWPTVAHEGLHQYLARHLIQRLPASLEEGLACTFESVSVTERAVRFDRRRNPRREQGLAAATRAGTLSPLNVLVQGHAGEIARHDLTAREAFYGQCWAMARVVLDTPSHAVGLRRLLADLRDGRAEPSIGDPRDRSAYRPADVRPMLERYVAPDWTAFERSVAAFVAGQVGNDRDD